MVFSQHLNLLFAVKNSHTHMYIFSKLLLFRRFAFVYSRNGIPACRGLYPIVLIVPVVRGRDGLEAESFLWKPPRRYQKGEAC